MDRTAPRLRRAVRLAAVLYFWCSAGPTLLTAQNQSRVVRLVAPDSPEVHVGIAVLREAYGRIGARVEAEIMAGDLAIRASTEGEVDGEVHRIDGLSDRFPQLVQIPIPINYLEIAILSKDAAFRPVRWPDLSGRDIGIVRGLVAAERPTRALGVRMVDTYSELLKLLEDGEVDAIVVTVVIAELARASGEISNDVVHSAVLDTHLLYHYLHQDRSELASEIEPILKEMLLDGTVGRIRDAVIEELIAASREENRP